VARQRQTARGPGRLLRGVNILLMAGCRATLSAGAPDSAGDLQAIGRGLSAGGVLFFLTLADIFAAASAFWGHSLQCQILDGGRVEASIGALMPLSDRSDLPCHRQVPVCGDDRTAWDGQGR
jgi:hypothetical protein